MAVNNHIEALLNTTGLPVAYRFFKPYKNKPVPPPPFLVYYAERESGRGSDDRNFYKQIHIVVELYTDSKTPTLEESVENAISAYEYEKSEDYIESEKMFLVTWEFDYYEKIRRE